MKTSNKLTSITKYFTYKLQNDFIWKNTMDMFENINRMKIQKDVINGIELVDKFTFDKEKLISFEVNDLEREEFYEVEIELIYSKIESKSILKLHITPQSSQFKDEFCDFKTIENYYSQLEKINVPNHISTQIESILIQCPKNLIFNIIKKIDAFYSLFPQLVNECKLLDINTETNMPVYMVEFKKNEICCNISIKYIESEEKENLWRIVYQVMNPIKNKKVQVDNNEELINSHIIIQELEFEMHEITDRETFFIFKHIFHEKITDEKLKRLEEDKKYILDTLKNAVEQIA